MTPAWDFEYRPIAQPRQGGEQGPLDVVVATRAELDAAHAASALGALLSDLEVTPLFGSAPIFWTRVRSSCSALHAGVARALERAGIGVRYVASAREGSDALGPPLDFSAARRRRARDWVVQPSRAHRESWESGRWFLAGSAKISPACIADRESWESGRWFLGEDGVAVERAVCGTGAGTRLAIIDDDAGASELLDLDAQVSIDVEHVPRATGHAALLSAWAAGAERFAGVAPDASLRHYYIQKPGQDVVSLPLAIAQAVEDGADVILCATNVDGACSPMLDDALELAVRAGRRGRGAAVVMPTSRECSSPAGAAHASLTLGLGEPASDPRVLCVGPSARDGGWFLYRDQRGRLRPFANRGPAVRWLAPGDDLADPFRPGRLAHAESSGASAVAAGALLLVLGRNPDLPLERLAELVTRTATPIAAAHEDRAGETFAPEVRPLGRDADGHDAKHGYGRIHATRACLAASDPVAAALLEMGEEQAAQRWVGLQGKKEYYSLGLARWGAEMLVRQPRLSEALRALCRHARLIAAEPRRAAEHTPGALARHASLLLREVLESAREAPPALGAELEALASSAAASTRAEGLGESWTRELAELAPALWPEASGSLRMEATRAAS